MAGDAYGAETQEEPKAQEDIRKQQAAEVAKNAKVAEALRGEIAELKAQGESDRIDFKLQLAGVRNVKVALSWATTAATSTRSRRRSRGCSPTPLQSNRAAGRGFPVSAPARTPARPCNASELPVLLVHEPGLRRDD